MHQTWENGKKLNLRPNFGLFDPHLGPIFFLIGLTSSSSNIVASCNCIQFQGKLMNQTWKNDKKSSFGTDFGPFGLNLGSKKNFYEFYLY